MPICTVLNLPENGAVSSLVCLKILCCWHRRQPLTQTRMLLSMFGPKYQDFLIFTVGEGPGCKML